MQAFYKQLSIHRRKLIGLGTAIAIYGLAGFFLLPWYLEKQLLNISQDRLDLNFSVESIYFNPFSFYFEINELVLNELDETPLFSLSHAHTNLQASRLFLLKAQLAEVSIDGVELSFNRKSASENTLTTLAQRWSNSSQNLSPETAEPTNEEQAEETELPAVEIIKLSITNFNANLSDNSLITPFQTTVGITQIQIDGFSTLPDTHGTNNAVIDFEQQSQLNASGEFSINPLQLNGTVSLDDFPVDIVSRYAQDSLPASIDSGRIRFDFNYAADFAQASPAIVIDELFAELSALSVTENGTAEPFAELDSLAVANTTIRIPDNSVELESLTLESLSLAATLNNNKQLNLLRMLESFTASLLSAEQEELEEETSTKSEAATAPWSVDLATFNIQNTSLVAQDESLEQLFILSSSINGSIASISTEPNRRFPFDLNLSLGSGGELILKGDLQALPELDLNANVEVSELDLAVLQPYINEFSFAELERGTLALDAVLAVNSADPFSFRGSLSLLNLSASDSQLDEKLVAFDSLEIDAMNFSRAANNFEISEIALQSLFARVIINEDGSSNIGRSIKPAQTESDENIERDEVSPEINAQSSESDSAPMAITVGSVRINNGAANFTDKDLPIVFNANIANLNGSAEGFATNTVQATKVDLEGQVDEFGLVQISSVIRPFAFTEQSEVRVNFTNISMPAMTPYVIKFAGREIIEGNIDLELYYDINSGALQANNQLVLSDLRLGEKIEHPDAMDLPLDLALALLKDGNGVIDLEVPITGDVNDPEFNFGPAIRRAMANVLTNIVTAPFKLLSGLVGSGDDSLDSIRFLPGRADIAAPEREVLVKLKEALQLRPQLVLEIPPVTAAEDITALKTNVVNQRIDAALELTQESEELLTTRRRTVLENLYLAAAAASPNPAASLTEIQQLHTAADAIDPAVETKAALDIIAYNSELRQRLIDLETLTVAELETLANARANAVSNFFLDDGSLSAQRIQLLESGESELDEDGWLIMTFKLSSNN